MDKGEDASLVTAAVMDGNEALMEHDRAVSQHDIDVVAGPEAAAAARHAIAALGELQVRQRIDAVQLATSELVTNAIRHGVFAGTWTRSISPCASVRRALP
jgi:hypothetical protein